MDKQILNFYNNENLRKLVRSLLEETANEMAVDTIKNGQEAIGFEKAYKVIDTAFAKMKKEAKE